MNKADKDGNSMLTQQEEYIAFVNIIAGEELYSEGFFTFHNH